MLIVGGKSELFSGNSSVLGMLTFCLFHRPTSESVMSLLENANVASLTILAPKVLISETEKTFDAALWKKIAEQGWTGILIPEDYGGGGMGMVELAAA